MRFAEQPWSPISESSSRAKAHFPWETWLRGASNQNYLGSQNRTVSAQGCQILWLLWGYIFFHLFSYHSKTQKMPTFMATFQAMRSSSIPQTIKLKAFCQGQQPIAALRPMSSARNIPSWRFCKYSMAYLVMSGRFDFRTSTPFCEDHYHKRWRVPSRAKKSSCLTFT